MSKQRFDDGVEQNNLEQLIENGMPEKKKDRKTKNVTEEVGGGAEVFIPTKKKNKKPRYPKGFDPANPGQEPDPERWLPKWQRSKYKRLAKKRGIVLKGAQGDALVDTDVTAKFNKDTSTAHKEVTETKKKNKKKGR